MPKLEDKNEIEKSITLTDKEITDMGFALIKKRDELVTEFVKSMSAYKSAEYDLFKLESNKRKEFENPKSRVDLIKAQIATDLDVAKLKNEVIQKEIKYKEYYNKLEAVKSNQSMLQSIIRMRVPDMKDLSLQV